MSKSLTHDHYMEHALSLAVRTTAYTSPNPRVGCVIVKDGHVIGEGWHNGPGTDHAEVMALKSVSGVIEGADVYVTLEPCCHHGRTPPCTEALIAAKVARVYIASLDPNPLVSGKGVQMLEESGIIVEHGFLRDTAEKINRYYLHFMRKQRPYIICKWAMSLDGYMTTSTTDVRQISSSESQQHNHLLRHQVDAILIGYNTAILDNPQLTTRFFQDGLEIRHPIRLILDSRGQLPLSLTIFSPDLPAKTVIVTTNQSSLAWRKACQNANIEIWIVDGVDGRVSLQDLMQYCYEKRVLSVLVEGGRAVHEAFFRENIVDEVRAYIAPVIIGGHDTKKIISTAGDSYVRGYC